MGIRTGREVLEGMRDGRTVHIDGERVTDVTRDPRFAGGARTLASLYDLQHRPELQDELTYRSPTTGDRVGLSYIEPKTPEDLKRRRVMVKHWHDYTLGMFGRAPDFLNVVISTYASCSEALGQYGKNMRTFYERCRENDLVATHSLANPQVDRSNREAPETAARTVADNDKGIVVRGARMLSTLAAYSDELMVMPPPSGRMPDTEAAKALAYGFAIPIATKGLRFICRPSLAHAAGSPLDHPISSRYDESDGMIVFDDVLVPWERVFIYRDVQTCNSFHRKTDALAPSSQEFTIKMWAKAEFMMALGFALAKATRVDEHQHVQGMLGELINTTEVVKACVLASEADAHQSKYGILMPAPGPVEAMRFMFPPLFKRACEIIQHIGAGGLFMVPSFAEVDGPLKDDVARFYQAANADSRSRIKLFRLALDAALSTFAGRQQLYERYFAGDPVRGIGGLYNGYEKEPHIKRIQDLLERFEREAEA
jgi:4-hydroxyphenylacetate 3-monooxygenase